MPVSSSSPPFDLFVIGAGSGGVRAARMAAQRGARVAIADDAPLGGTCVNLGCIPKKLYSYAAHYGEAFEESHGFGWTLEPPRFDWEVLKANRAREITRLNGVYEKLLLDAGVTLLRGRARLAGANGVEVESAGARDRSGSGGGRTLHRATNILVATGGHPLVPELAGRELAITSDEVFDLATFPRRLVVVGGGYIACEFASIFSGLGAQVTQLYRGEQVLRGFDADVRDFVASEMRKNGIDLRTHMDAERIEGSAGALRVVLKSGATIE
ncbi:MAG TPA: FAD-dependent oxidoreductase, partial [Burkholderiaceae bacterium]|nr:FAD-dependent oxidoreductase [Burkholderiaceae bacterium]